MYSSATSFFGARSAAAACTPRTPLPIQEEKTLADLMRTAARKSRQLSSPKSNASMREVILQNRMVQVVNKALAENPLSMTVAKLDDRFINPNQQQQPTPFKFSPYAAVFTPSAAVFTPTTPPSSQSTMINSFTLQSEEAW